MDLFFRVNDSQVYPYLYPQQVPKIYSLTFVGDRVLRKSATWICNLGRDICSDDKARLAPCLSTLRSWVRLSEALRLTRDQLNLFGAVSLIFSEPTLAWGIYLSNYNIALCLIIASIMQREFCPVL